jgi:hypothetical protein
LGSHKATSLILIGPSLPLHAMPSFKRRRHCACTHPEKHSSVFDVNPLMQAGDHAQFLIIHFLLEPPFSHLQPSLFLVPQMHLKSLARIYTSDIALSLQQITPEKKRSLLKTVNRGDTYKS